MYQINLVMTSSPYHLFTYFIYLFIWGGSLITTYILNSHVGLQRMFIFGETNDSIYFISYVDEVVPVLVYSGLSQMITYYTAWLILLFFFPPRLYSRWRWLKVQMKTPSGEATLLTDSNHCCCCFKFNIPLFRWPFPYPVLPLFFLLSNIFSLSEDFCLFSCGKETAPTFKGERQS